MTKPPILKKENLKRTMPPSCMSCYKHQFTRMLYIEGKETEICEECFKDYIHKINLAKSKL